MTTTADSTTADSAAANPTGAPMAPLPGRRRDLGPSPPPALLDEVERIYEAGRYLTAWNLACSAGDPLTWRDPRACLLMGRVATNVGGRQAGAILHAHAYRRAPRQPDVVYFRAMGLLERRGPLDAWEFLRDQPTPDPAPPDSEALLPIARADVLVTLRDFDAADAELRRAEALAPEDAWLWVSRSRWAEAQDRTEEALAFTDRALAQRPLYRPALQQKAELLRAHGREEEALALLTTGMAQIESGGLRWQMALIERERGHVAEAWAHYRAVAALSPLMEPPMMRALAGACSEMAQRLGDRAAAEALARASGSPSLARLADRLAAGAQGRRVQLGVPYVRQHHRTCAPATLASICQLHRTPAEHLLIAEEICYDGTPAASERRWAVDNGHFAREFTVTWEAAVALLDRGFPFTLTTQETASAHLQAVIGYDELARTFLVRDPSTPHLVEYDVDILLSQQAWAGPRGMVFGPSDRAAALADVPLPDEPLHDRLHQLERALARHDRAAALAELTALESETPAHVITASAQRAVANYDGDQAGLLASYERQLEHHSRVPRLLLGKLSCLETLARQDARRALLEELVEDPDADPLFARLLADDLLKDARLAERAEALLRRTVRAYRIEASSYRSLAFLATERRRWDEAIALYRFATCLEPAQGGSGASFFWAARHAGRQDEALAFLRARVEALGRRFAQPACTLADALEAIGRTQEALDVLEQAMTLLPQDGPLWLNAVETFVRVGRKDRARALLETARTFTRDASWLRAAASLDLVDGDLPAARARYEDVLRIEPMAVDAHAELARLDASLLGRSAASARLRAAARTWPHHQGLARLRVQFTHDEGDEGVQVVRDLVAVVPDDAWAHRELALRLARRGRWGEIDSILQTAAALEPDSTALQSVRGTLAAWQNQPERAREAYTAALRISAENNAAAAGLFELARTREERQAILALWRQELRRQVTFGDGLGAYRSFAGALEPPEDRLALVEEARAARPDLPACWIAAVEELAAQGRAQDAVALAGEAAQCFPLVLDVHLALAAAHRRADDRAGARAALDEAFALAPTSPVVARNLADLLTVDGALDEARAVLERATRIAPLDRVGQAMLAEVLWTSGDRKAALDRLETALRIDPDYDWAWVRLADWAPQAGERERARSFAQMLAQERPGAPAAHMGLYFVLDPDHHYAECLAALDLAVACEPRFESAHDARARLLALVGDFEGALAACAPAAYGDHPPLRLRGRAAWIEAVRGERARAIAMARKLVAEAPQYVFAWKCLGDWLLADGDRPGAREAYARAIALDPSHTGAGAVLFDLQMQEGLLDAAEETLATLRREVNDDTTLRATMRLHLARGRREAATALFTEVACDAHTDIGRLGGIVQILDEHGGKELLAAELERLIEDQRARPEVGYYWAKHAARGPFFRLWPRLARLRRRGEIGIEATVGYLERGQGGPGWLLPLYLARNRAELHASTQTWAAVGFALVRRQSYRRALRWFGGWEARKDVAPFMLTNVVSALRACGDDEEAARASRLALELPADHAILLHRMWLAYDAVASEGVEEAARIAANAPEPQDEFGGLVHACMKGVLAARLRDVRRELRESLARFYLDEAEGHWNRTGRGRLGSRLRKQARSRVETLLRR